MNVKVLYESLTVLFWTNRFILIFTTLEMEFNLFVTQDTGDANFMCFSVLRILNTLQQSLIWLLALGTICIRT